MAQKQDGFDRLPAVARDGVRGYADLLLQLAGQGFRSLVVFGSAAGTGFDPQRDAVHNVVVFAAVDLELLRKLSDHGSRLGKARIHAPLIMTPRYIAASCDTFPLELIEIQQHHVVVVGEDPFAGLVFRDADVRHQCERELKVLLLALRQGLLAAAGRDKAVRVLGEQAAENLLRTIRGMLWLHGQREGRPAREVLAAMEDLCKRRLQGVFAALEHSASWSWESFQALYADVEALERWLDEPRRA